MQHRARRTRVFGILMHRADVLVVSDRCCRRRGRGLGRLVRLYSGAQALEGGRESASRRGARISGPALVPRKGTSNVIVSHTGRRLAHSRI